LSAVIQLDAAFATITEILNNILYNTFRFPPSKKKGHVRKYKLLRTLTKEQKLLIPKQVGYWVNLTLHSGRRVEIDAVEDYITDFYRRNKLQKPTILIFDSYMAAKVAVNILTHSEMLDKCSKNQFVDGQPGEQIIQYVWKLIKEQIEAQTGEQSNSTHAKKPNYLLGQLVSLPITNDATSKFDTVPVAHEDLLGEQVAPRVSMPIINLCDEQIRESVSRIIWRQTVEPIEILIRSEFAKLPPSFFSEQYSGLNTWAGWIAFYDYFERLGIIKSEEFDRYKDYLKSGIWSVDYFDKYVIISRLPTKVIRDQNGRLHSFTEPAVQWGADHLDNHFIHGVGFPADIWNSIVKKTISAKEAISLPDLAQRTIACQTIGYDSVLAELGAELIDEKTRIMPNGKDLCYKLYKINLKDDTAYVIDGYKIISAKFVKVECPSTGRETLLRVPPTIHTVRTAIAWTFGMRPDDYMPDAET
jgi:hypothetical protein